MSCTRVITIAVLVSGFAIASAQTLPPPPFAGQSYWYGPGPSAITVTSSSQTDGGYSEMYMSGGNWVAGVNGGPAFASVSAGGASISSTFNVTTTLTIEPYIYVDGYFGVTSNVTGFGGGSIDIGTSRFFVLHNVPINFHADSFTNLGLGGPSGTPTLPTIYNFSLYDYVNAAGYTSSGSITGGTSAFIDSLINMVDDDGILGIDITRHTTFPTGTPAGTYSGTGVVSISSV